MTALAATEGVPDWLGDRLVIIPAAVAVDICERVVDLGKLLPERPGPLFDHKTGKRYFDAGSRMTNVAWFHERDWVFDLMQGFAAQANADWRYDLTDADPMQFAIYRRHDFFEWHKDMLHVRGQHVRKISVVLQLDDPKSYRGGRLEFLDNDRGPFAAEEFSAQGSVAVFATLLKHRVTPIKDGERRSLTAWFKGPPFR